MQRPGQINHAGCIGNTGTEDSRREDGDRFQADARAAHDRGHTARGSPGEGRTATAETGSGTHTAT